MIRTRVKVRRGGVHLGGLLRAIEELQHSEHGGDGAPHLGGGEVVVREEVEGG